MLKRFTPFGALRVVRVMRDRHAATVHQDKTASDLLVNYRPSRPIR
jgi:hypothetical protein